ncbi:MULTISPECIES: TrkA family potassium uptake protein [unclassified Halorhabdus]|uniref:potassium channel family protein n=1 Tax=unclassified Halorhabdus TaxID=2621901 RepID=UPI0023DAAF40|nr:MULTISPECIES: TrkA family potassium uptake protein [unclassified Halorhabdus]WEL16273.1 TrkA, K transport system, NAD-binding component [Halorhabdus sp. SVX81]WEL20164.1 TrkA, K+ transport system, NAD-binding component [Halorhabdus sp. BNX81]
MDFVIVGFGRVGMRTAHVLIEEGHDVTIVEIDSQKAERAREEGFETVLGDCNDEDVLAAAGIATADAIAGLTGDLNANFSACMIGKHHGARTVLRIDEDYRQELYEKYASDVDEVIYPERLGAAGAKTAMLGGDFNVLADLTEHLTVASIRIPEESPVIGTRVVRLDLPGDAQVYAHGRDDEPMSIPLPRTTIQAGDRIAITSPPEAIDDVRASLDAEQSAA